MLKEIECKNVSKYLDNLRMTLKMSLKGDYYHAIITEYFIIAH